MSIEGKQKFLIAFGNRIKALRIKKQMSLDELARKCGYTSENARSSMQKIESGKSDISASKISLIAKALDTTEAYLMGWLDEWKQKYNAGGKLVKKVSLLEAIEKLHGKGVTEALDLYTRLDTEDQAEIRGEMKQMLKASKYLAKEGSSEGKAM